MAELAARLRRRTWRTWYGLKWQLSQRRDAGRPHIRRTRGLDVMVLPGVLDPAWFLSSDVLVDAIADLVRRGDQVLDLGTGTAVGALAALRAGAGRVVATDIDPVAIRCATATLAMAGAQDRVELRLGDLFDPVAGERFDLVAFNPPWLDTADGLMELALRVDVAVATRFALEVASHLAPGGRAIVILSTAGRPDAWLGPLRAADHRLEVVLERDRGSESLSAWLVTPTR